MREGVGCPPSRRWLTPSSFQSPATGALLRGAYRLVAGVGPQHLIPSKGVRGITKEGVTFLYAGKLLEETLKRALDEALPR
ncbi:MAG: hypothetical protein QXQ60_03385 [Thermofilum sp.]